MKGFIHVIEIIIITMVMFIIMLQFTFVPGIPQDFSREKLSLFSNDVLSVLDKGGINWLNRTAIEERMNAVLGNGNLVYDINIRNGIKSPIIVGCICSEIEFSSLGQILTPFSANGQRVEFQFERLKPPSQILPPAFEPADATLPLFYDVIIAMDYDLAGDTSSGPYDYTQQLYSFLGNGKGIVQIRDLDSAELSLAERRGKIQRYFFGTESNLSSIPDGMALDFQVGVNSSYWNIRKYFHGLPAYFEDFDDGTAGGWVSQSGSWAIQGGRYFQAPSGNGLTHYQGINRSEVAFSAKINSPSGTGSQFLVWRSGGRTDSKFYYFGSETIGTTDKISVGYSENGVMQQLAQNTAINLLPDRYYEYKIVHSGERVRAFIDNSLVFDISSSLFPSGLVGLKISGDGMADDVRVGIPDPSSFPNFLGANEKISVSEGYGFSDNNIIIEQEDGPPALIANKEFSVPSDIDNPLTFQSTPVFLSGRVAWLSNGPDSLENQELIRSLVVWASGDEYHIIQRTTPDPVIATFVKTIDGDFFQSLEIILKISYTF